MAKDKDDSRDDSLDDKPFVDRGWLANAITAFFDGLRGLMRSSRDLLPILQILLPAIMIYMQYITKTQLTETKAELAATKAQVVQKAEEAVDEAKQVKHDLAHSTEERKESEAELKELQRTGLLQWKAYNSKKTDDMIDAKTAETRAFSQPERPPARPEFP